MAFTAKLLQIFGQKFLDMFLKYFSVSNIFFGQLLIFSSPEQSSGRAIASAQSVLIKC